MDRLSPYPSLGWCFEASRIVFHINEEVLPPSQKFPYLGWTIAYNNSNWPEVYQNLRKARQRWEMIVRVLVNTVATVQAQGMMYKVVAQSVLLYLNEIWVVTG